MTRVRLVLTVILALVVAGARGGGHVPAVRAQPAPIALTEAMEQGFVRAEFLGTGAASGAAIRLEVTRTGARDLSITVPVGMLLRNSEPQEQDMTVRRLLGEAISTTRYQPATAIELRDDQTRTYVLEAYCLEADLDNPSRNRPFTYDGFAQPDVIAVLEAAERVPDAADEWLIVQAAAWAVTDDVTREKLAAIGYELTDDELAMVAGLLRDAGLEPARFRLFG